VDKLRATIIARKFRRRQETGDRRQETGDRRQETGGKVLSPAHSSRMTLWAGLVRL